METGFPERVKKISAGIKGIAYKLNGKYAYVDHDDLYQEAVLHLWKEYKLNTFLGKNDSYLLQGCYYYLRNYVRNMELKSRNISIYDKKYSNSGRDKEYFVAKEEKPPEDEVFMQELSGLLEEKEKKVFLLLSEGYTIREIAGKTGVSHPMIIKTRKKIAERTKKYFMK